MAAKRHLKALGNPGGRFMLVVSGVLQRAMGLHRREAALAQGLAHMRQHHPAWCHGRDDAGLRRHVAATMAFAAQHGVHQEGNLPRLLDASVLPGFCAQPTGYALWRLTQPGFDETTRVLNFIAALRMDRAPLVISLGTDLRALDAQETQALLDAFDALQDLGRDHG